MHPWVAGFFSTDAKSLAMKTSTSALRIAVAAMLVALSFVTSLLPSLPGPITKFNGFPLLLGGLLVGPRTGFAVGCIADLLGFMVRPTGPFFPGFTLTQGLTALIPALFARMVDPLTWRRSKTEEKEVGHLRVKLLARQPLEATQASNPVPRPAPRVDEAHLTSRPEP